jgi:hypothetical protein
MTKFHDKLIAKATEKEIENETVRRMNTVIKLLEEHDVSDEGCMLQINNILKSESIGLYSKINYLPTSGLIEVDGKAFPVRVAIDEIIKLVSKDTQNAPEKSTGGSSGYYKLKVLVEKDSVIERDSGVMEVELETSDAIKALVNNDFDLGNIIKAARRVSQSLEGKGKAGTSMDYDLNKIIYFANEIKRKQKLKR